MVLQRASLREDEEDSGEEGEVGILSCFLEYNQIKYKETQKKCKHMQTNKNLYDEDSGEVGDVEVFFCSVEVPQWNTHEHTKNTNNKYKQQIQTNKQTKV